MNIVEYGKPKDDKGLPVFNLSLVFDQNNRVPLFYEEYPGSVTDVAQLKYVIDKVTAYGYKRMGFILDRVTSAVKISAILMKRNVPSS